MLTANTKKLKAAKAELFVNEKNEKRKENTLEEYKKMLLQVKQELLKEVIMHARAR